MTTQESKTIDRWTFTVAKPFGRQGQQMALRIGKWAFPFYGAFLASGGDARAVMSAIGDVIATLQGPELDYLNETLGNLTQVSWADEKGSPMSKTLDLKFNDVLFQDRLDMWLEWLVFAIQTTMRSFFNGAMGFGAMLKKGSPESSPTEAPSNSKSPNSVERTG